MSNMHTPDAHRHREYEIIYNIVMYDDAKQTRWC